MLLQSDKTLPPPGPKPNFKALAIQYNEHDFPNEWIKIPDAQFMRGMTDVESEEAPSRYFGWDNEKPRRQVQVSAFEAKAKPLTNGEYAHFLEETGKSQVSIQYNIVCGSMSLHLVLPDLYYLKAAHMTLECSFTNLRARCQRLG